MPNHCWGDKWFEEHGDDLNSAIDFCIDFWRKWGRIGSHGKEKYGTFRHHVYFYNAWWALHELAKPGYVSYRWPKWIMHIDIFFGKIVCFLSIQRLFNRWQGLVYNYAIQKACTKYPDIVDELVSDSDHSELIKPGLFGKIDGQEIHDKYWTSI